MSFKLKRASTTRSGTILDTVYSLDTAYINGHLYVFTAAIVDDMLSVFNVDDPTSPSYITNISGALNYLNGINFIEVVQISGTWYAVCTANIQNALTLIDVDDPSNPTYVSHIAGSGSPNYLYRPYGVKVKFIDGTPYAFVAAYLDYSLTIIDISDPPNPAFVGHIAGSGAPNRLNGAYNVDVQYIDGHWYAFVTAYIDDRLTIFNIDDLTAPVHVRNTPAIDGATAVKVEQINGNWYAFVAAYSDDGFYVVDVNNPSNAQFVASHINEDGPPEYLNGATALDTVQVGDQWYLLIGSALDGSISAYNITDPRHPSFETTVVSLFAPGYLEGIRDVKIQKLESSNQLYIFTACPERNSLSIYELLPGVASNLRGRYNLATSLASESIPIEYSIAVGNDLRIRYQLGTSYSPGTLTPIYDIAIGERDVPVVYGIEAPVQYTQQVLYDVGFIDQHEGEFFVFDQVDASLSAQYTVHPGSHLSMNYRVQQLATYSPRSLYYILGTWIGRYKSNADMGTDTRVSRNLSDTPPTTPTNPLSMGLINSAGNIKGPDLDGGGPAPIAVWMKNLSSNILINVQLCGMSFVSGEDPEDDEWHRLIFALDDKSNYPNAGNAGVWTSPSDRILVTNSSGSDPTKFQPGEYAIVWVSIQHNTPVTPHGRRYFKLRTVFDVETP